jgi:short-subunit dehydrogenase
VTAEILAKKGARIVLVARDKTRGDAILARLRNRAPGAAHSLYFADLTRLADMKRVAAAHGLFRPDRGYASGS